MQQVVTPSPATEHVQDNQEMANIVNLEIFVVKIFSQTIAGTKINVVKTHAHY